MTHLSDLSYVQRGVSSAWFYGWFIVYVYRWDRFEALRLRRLLRFELRSIITILVLIAMALQLVYDIGSARLKYIEGFWVNPETKEIQSKPAQAWSTPDMVHVEPLYYTLACALASQNSVFFLLQSFWSYISKSVAKSTFMSSFEFKVNIVCSCFVMALFPTVQYLFRNDFVYREVVPQMIFSIVTFITGVLGIRTHFRLVALIKNAREIMNETTVHVLQKLEYFKDMNMILTFGFFGTSLPLGIMSADGLTSNPVIAHNKFASDFLITNLNFFEFIMWVTLILIFYPRRTDTGASPFGPDLSKNRQSKDAYLPRFNEIKPQDVDSYRREEPMQSIDSYRPWSKELPLPATSHHHRTLSNESRQATLVPITSLPLAVTKSNDKAEIVTTTIYYHEGLAKAQQQQQQQQQEQANKNQTKAVDRVSLSSNHTHSSSTPLRSFSQNSHYNTSGHKRSVSHASVLPLVPKPRKYSTRSANASVDYHQGLPSSREYPSLVQETANWSYQPTNAQRSFSSSSGHEPRHPYNQHHHQHQHPTINEVEASNAEATSGSVQERSSIDSDREMIQVAYIRNMSQEEGVTTNDSKFYEDLGRAHSVNTASARPFSPQHF